MIDQNGHLFTFFIHSDIECLIMSATGLLFFTLRIPLPKIPIVFVLFRLFLLLNTITVEYILLLKIRFCFNL